MLGRKGQAFDAFKLLIAAVVAGAILVIILSMLNGFNAPSGNPTTVMSQLVQSLKSSVGSGKVSMQVVQFRPGDVVGADGVEQSAGVNPGTVHFCASSGGESDMKCPPQWVFNSTYFTATSSSVTAHARVSGRIRVYNANGQFYIGFTTNTSLM